MFIGALLPQTNLQASWQGNSINDISGNSKTLTNTNSVGLTSYGFDFGLTNSTKQLSIAEVPGLNNASDYTIIWTIKQITEIGSGLQNWWNINFTTARYAQAYYDYNSGTRRIIFDHSSGQAIYNITLGTSLQYQLAAVRSGSNMIFYVNGIQQATGTVGSAGGSGTAKTVIGSGDGSNYDSGIIKNFAIFDTAKTDDRIKRIYENSFGRKTIVA